MRLDDEFRDLAPLRPSTDQERWERMLASVEAAAAPELARRAARGRSVQVIDLLGRWRWPAISTATATALVGVLAIISNGESFRAGPEGIASALGYPDAVTQWLYEEASPSVEDLLFTVSEEDR